MKFPFLRCSDGPVIFIIALCSHWQQVRQAGASSFSPTIKVNIHYKPTHSTTLRVQILYITMFVAYMAIFDLDSMKYCVDVTWVGIEFKYVFTDKTSIFMMLWLTLHQIIYRACHSPFAMTYKEALIPIPTYLTPMFFSWFLQFSARMVFIALNLSVFLQCFIISIFSIQIARRSIHLDEEFPSNLLKPFTC